MDLVLLTRVLVIAIVYVMVGAAAFVLTRRSLTKGEKAMYLLCWPGYCIVYLHYFFPTEWGATRNVTRSSRQFAYRNFFAVFYSVIVYFIVYFFAREPNVRAFLWGFFGTLLGAFPNSGDAL